MQHTIKNVEALWPRINRTYKFDAAERKSVPSDPKDPLSAYELSFRMSANQAKELFAEMAKAYNERRKTETAWPEKFTNPFKKEDETGCWIGKVKLKGNYNGELTQKPKQYDNTGQIYGDDFLLTTGSKINIALTCVPYNMREAGVSLRLRAVQVVEYREMVQENPFGNLTGGPVADAFGLPPVESQNQNKKPEPIDDFGDEIPF